MPIFSNRPESNVIQRSLRWLIAPTVFLFFAFAPYNVRAQSTPLNQRVLVVYNSADPDSTSVANYYIAQRAIPAGNLCPITPSSTTFLAWGDFVTTVKAPIQSCLNAVGASNILFRSFAYKTPYDVIAPDSNTYAVDEFIADIWDQYIPANQFGIPLAAHPYYAVNQAEGNVYVPFQSLATFRSQNPTLIYAVWRLDAPTAALAKGLVDKALLAESTGLSGQVCIDETSSIAPYDYDNGVPEWDLRMAAQFARLAGFSVTEDQNSAEFGTSPAPLRCDGAALYSGWYS